MQFKRLFTQGAADPYGLINFRQPEGVGDGFDIPLEHPDGWSREAVETLADEAASSALSPDLKPVEENTVPSWLWQKSRAKIVGKKETSVKHIFDRVAGAATYFSWKKKLFKDEDQARVFFDEARYVLATRMLGIEPQKLGILGLKWAYGIDVPMEKGRAVSQSFIDISNVTIDTIVSGKRDRAVLNAWQKIVSSRTKETSLNLRFSDTEAQWEMPAENIAGARINLMTLRHNDGSVNIEALCQVTRIAVILMDMQNEASGDTLVIGHSNLAPLLMALALPYDSEGGRATAAAICAIITAEAYATSAELSDLFGASPAFMANREACLRALRNHRRAAYGEQNDYEKMPVTPTPLLLASCPDLALTAAARSAWDDALQLAQVHGLRHTQMTGLFSSPALTLLMESETEGLSPMRSLAIADSENNSERSLHPSVLEGLTRLEYEPRKIRPIVRHVTGAGTLKNAPFINHETLRERGFTLMALENLEEYLPQAKQLRYAFTPWVLGVDFCRNDLKVSASKIDDVRFNLLQFLGFTEQEIAAAEAYCYGHDRMDGAEGLLPQHATAFATAVSLSPEAQIRMAAAVQGFVSGETNLKLTLPVGLPAERFEKLLLDAWRRGVKSLAVRFDASLPYDLAQPDIQNKKLRKIASSVILHAKAPALPKRQSRSSVARHGGETLGKTKIRDVSKGH